MSVSSSEVTTTAGQNAAADQDWEQPRYSRRDTLLTMLGARPDHRGNGYAACDRRSAWL
jgi:hypothetical protein